MNAQWQSLLADITLQPLNLDGAQLFVSPLTDNGLISLQGEQSQSYLQGQVTADVYQLKADGYLNSAHCDAKGKMWSISQIFSIDKQLFLTGHQDEMQASLEQLQKYGVFAQTTISDASSQWLTFGIGGSAADDFVSSISQQLSADSKLINLANNQYLLVLPVEQATEFVAQHQSILFTQQQWTLTNIQTATPHLTQTAINQYVPQMLNLQALDAISFSKGCYTGQEMVARMKYLGKNKRATFIIKGSASQKPQPGSELQLAIGENWRRGGNIINIAGTEQSFYALAIMANDIEPQAQLRIKDDELSSISILELPYSLATETE